MLRLKTRSFLTPLVAAAFLACFPGDQQTTADRPVAGAAPFYVVAGDRVEARYQDYRKLLGAYYETLLRAAQMRAPDLVARIQEQPQPLFYGYRVLPTIVPDPAPMKTPAREAVSYSWPWTEQMIERERRELLLSISELRTSRSKAVLEKHILEYPKARERYNNVGAHARYNRFWQAAIAADRATYDHETALQVRAHRYRRVIDILQAMAAVLPKKISEGLSHFADRLMERIGAALHRVDRPSFVAVERCDDEWTVRVPVFTDIEERPFVAAVERIIESAWQVTDGEKRLRVELDVSYVSPASLYETAEEPAKDVPIDLENHLARFPAKGAILTTGALTTHVRRHAIVLGPGTITPRLIAHEFGHILGFRDAYIRGYRDLHQSGFQIRELAVLPNDIMAASAGGEVRPGHFRRLIDASTNRAMCAPTQSAEVELSGLRRTEDSPGLA